MDDQSESTNAALILYKCVSCYDVSKIATLLTLQRAGNARQQPLPCTSCHLHTSVKSRIALKIIHDNAMVTTDDMLVDALPAKMFEDFVDTINAVKNRLERLKKQVSKRGKPQCCTGKGIFFKSQATMTCLKTALTQKLICQGFVRS